MWPPKAMMASARLERLDWMVKKSRKPADRQPQTVEEIRERIDAIEEEGFHTIKEFEPTLAWHVTALGSIFFFLIVLYFAYFRFVAT